MSPAPPHTRRSSAPVVAAEVLLHHGLSDEAILSYLARSWRLVETDCRSALNAAHILLRREQAVCAGAADR
jgi:hypothetical protein